MRKLAIAFLLIFGIMVMSLPCLGSEFHPMGFEAVSMGGVGVASTNGGYAAYYNPALLAKYKNKMHIATSVGLGYREINIVESIDTLADVEIEETLEELSNLDYTSSGSGVDVAAGYLEQYQRIQGNINIIMNALRELSDKNGLQIMPGASIGAQVGHFGFGVYGISEATAFAIVDGNKLEIIVPADLDDDGIDDEYVKFDDSTGMLSVSSAADYNAHSLETGINDGSTYLKLSGAVYAEIPIAYGHAFSFSWGDLSLGGAFKIMVAQTYDQKVSIDTESGEVSDEMDESEESDTSWGIDMGMLYNPAKLKNLSAGLVLKNLNTPSFTTFTGDTLEIDPQIRAGIAYEFAKQNITCAMDFDISENETFIEDYYAQYVGFGVNYHPFSWFSLRGGVMQNIQESDEGMVLTAGLGAGVKWLQLDIAGQYSLESGEFDGEDIPKYGRVQVSLVSKWF